MKSPFFGWWLGRTVKIRCLLREKMTFSQIMLIFFVISLCLSRQAMNSVAVVEHFRTDDL